MWFDVLDVQFAGNELWRLLLFCLVVLSFLAAGRILRQLMSRAGARGTSGRAAVLDVVLAALSRPIFLLATAGAFWLSFATHLIILPPGLQGFVDTVLRVFYASVFGYAVYCLVDVVDHYLGLVVDRSRSKVDQMLTPLVGRSIRITVLVVVALHVAQSLSDKPVASLLAGLGVGGLAVALASQETLKNFFGSLQIIADKPFDIGDRIVVDGHDGPVESVGFRSTRIRTLEGHLVSVPNGELVNRTILNIGKRPHIRRLANITVTYDTSPEKMQKAIAIVKELLDNHEGMAPDFPPRVFFSGFNDWSLNILVLYWYQPADYWKYMEFSERFNLAVLERFNAEGIEFAFPTRTIHMEGATPDVVKAHGTDLAPPPGELLG